MSGGDAFVFTDLPKGAGDPKWSADGKSIVFTSGSNPEDLAKQAKKKKKEEEAKTAAAATFAGSTERKEKGSEKRRTEEHESDVHVVTRAVYREDDEGYLDPKRPQHLWIVTVPRKRR